MGFGANQKGNGMNRRQFTLGTLISLTALFLTGCQGASITQPQLQALLAVIGKALAKLMPFLRTMNSKLAGDIEAAYKALDDFAQNYKPGDAIKDVEALVNALVDNLQAIVPYVPQVGPYIGLIQLIVATVEGLLALLPNASLTPANMNVDAKRDGKHVVVKIMTSQGWITITDPPSTGPAFTAAWDKLAPAEMQI
jgi:hypothetical protein